MNGQSVYLKIDLSLESGRSRGALPRWQPQAFQITPYLALG